ncbi:MAG: ral secretion pathway protein, partial [Acidimicrobiaceae bacterium]
EDARAARATEVLVEADAAGGRVRLRIDGVLQEAARLTKDALGNLRGSLGELVAASAGIELVTLPTLHGDTVVVRLVGHPGAPRTLDELDVGDDAVGRLRSLIAGGHGAVVVTGPSGAGVTTTLHALLGDVSGSGIHLVAVEDPVERELDGVTQVVVHPDLPVATTVRRAIESRPDVLLLGDVRDGATAATALDAALSGRLVLAGLTGRDAAAVPGRFLAMGLEPVLVASALRGVVAQRLVRRLCEACKSPWTPSDAELDAAGWDDALDDVPTLYRAAGCDACQDIGYHGVAAIAEVLVMTDDLARLLALRANQSDLHKLAVAQGMQGLRQSGLALVRAGTTSLAEVARVS